MKAVIEEVSPFKLVAGHPVLDFANTLDNRYMPAQMVDLIQTYADLLRFCLEAGVITRPQASSLAGSDTKTVSALHKAAELREALYQIFLALLTKAAIPQSHLLTLNNILGDALQHRILTSETPGEIGWKWVGLAEDPAAPVWLLAESAVNLLVSEDAERVSQCGSETCRWLFLDTSKNHSRRWCDMKLCGNRVKARNHYQRGRTEHADVPAGATRD